MKTIDYDKQANDFLSKTGTEFKAEFKKFGKHFDDDKHERFIFNITLKRGEIKYTFAFGKSLKDAEDFLRLFVKDSWKMNFSYPTKVLYDADQVNHIKPMLTLKNCSGRIPKPSAYDVLACLTKYDPGTFEDFCLEFGYNEDSRKSEKIYKAVCDEWSNVQKLWNDSEIELLQEIQ